MRKEPSIGWLHLTDLHVGMSADHLWGNVQTLLLDDLRRLHDTAGPWDFLFFTGDLTQRGKEFALFDERLSQILAVLKSEGSEPLFLAVPGNHDLVRPSKADLAASGARRWNSDLRLREAFWGHAPTRLRTLVEGAFGPWSQWYADRCAVPGLQSGLLPGDFSVSRDVRGIQVGVLGLNTAFLHLEDGQHPDGQRGRLGLDARQAAPLCNGGTLAWSRLHDVCFLLTHHPPDWLHPLSRVDLENEIDPAGAMIHLYGHDHVGGQWTDSSGGGPDRNRFLGRSLFGLDSPDRGGRAARSHGYLTGRVWVGRERSWAAWPRLAERAAGGGWQFIFDAPRYSQDGILSRTRMRNFGRSPRQCADEPPPVSQVFARVKAEHSEFVGRRAALDAVNSLLAQERGFLLIEGDPGFGKTALLAQIWRRRPDAVVYFFQAREGRRAKSEFLAVLHEQLAAADHLRPVAAASEAGLEAAIATCLAADHLASPVFLIVDALDEADFDLRPMFLEPGRGVHVLLSARSSAVERAVLPRSQQKSVFPLGPLEAGELGDILQGARLPAELATALHEITLGDPLYLRVLLDELNADGADPAARVVALQRDIADGVPHVGLDQRLDEWWTDLSGEGRRGLPELLALLVVAEGPLSSMELAVLAREWAIEACAPDALLASSRRYISRTPLGISLSHDRFRAYLLRRLAHLVGRAREILVRWCRAWEGRTPPENRYAFANLTGHLLRSGRGTGDPIPLLDTLASSFPWERIRWERQHAPMLEDISRAFELPGIWGLSVDERTERLLGLVLLDEEVHANLQRVGTDGTLVRSAREGRFDAALQDSTRQESPNVRVLDLLLLAELSASGTDAEAPARFGRAAAAACAVVRTHRVRVSYAVVGELIDLALGLSVEQLALLAPALEALAFNAAVDELALATWYVRRGFDGATQAPRELAGRVSASVVESLGAWGAPRSPFHRVAHREPGFAEALAALAAAESREAADAAFEGLWNAWRQARTSTDSQDEAPEWYIGLRGRLRVPVDTHAPPRGPPADGAPLEHARAALAAYFPLDDPSAEGRLPTADGPRALALARRLASRPPESARCDSEEALQRLGSASELDLDEIRTILTAVARGLGVPQFPPTALRRLRAEEALVLRAGVELVALTGGAREERRAYFVREAHSLLDYYASEPNRGLAVLEAALIAAPDPVASFQAAFGSGATDVGWAAALGQLYVPGRMTEHSAFMLTRCVVSVVDNPAAGPDLEPLLVRIDELFAGWESDSEDAEHQTLPRTRVLAARLLRASVGGGSPPPEQVARFVDGVDAALASIRLDGDPDRAQSLHACCALFAKLAPERALARAEVISGWIDARLRASRKTDLGLLVEFLAVQEALGPTERLRRDGERLARALAQASPGGLDMFAQPGLAWLRLLSDPTRLKLLIPLMVAARAGARGLAEFAPGQARLVSLATLLIDTRLALTSAPSRGEVAERLWRLIEAADPARARPMHTR